MLYDLFKIQTIPWLETFLPFEYQAIRIPTVLIDWSNILNWDVFLYNNVCKKKARHRKIIMSRKKVKQNN